MSEIFQKIYDCLQGKFPEIINSNHKSIPDTYDITNFSNDIGEPPIQYDFELDKFQKKAVYRVSQFQNVFVAGHTSSGKTVVAEWAIAQSLKRRSNVIYTSPIKALSNQKYRDFKDKFSSSEYKNDSRSIIGIITGDTQVNETASCLVMTTEILRNMIYKSSPYLNDVEWVIFDEIHYMNDNERGRVWEEIIQMAPKHISMIFLSATTPNAIQFSDWVSMTREKPVYISQTLTRPIPIEHYLNTGNTQETLSQYYEEHIEKDLIVNEKIKVKVKQNGEIITKNQEYVKINKSIQQKENIDCNLTNKDFCFKIVKHQEFLKDNFSKALSYLNNKNTRTVKHKTKRNVDKFQKRIKFATKIDYIINLFKLLKLKNKLPAIVFAFSRKGCETYCNQLTSLDFTTKREKSKIKQFITQSLTILNKQDRNLSQIEYVSNLLSRGIGIHHSGLLPILKEIVEIMFQSGFIKILFATETFAMGVNMPARTVIFTSLEKHDGTQFRSLLPGEYIQMAGRAGRRGYDEKGIVIILTYDKIPNMIEKIVTGKPLTLDSKYYLTYQTIVSILQLSQHDTTMSISHLLRNSYGEHNVTMNLSQIQYSTKILQESKVIYKKLVKLSKLQVIQIKKLDDCYQSMETILPFMERLHDNTFMTLYIGPKKRQKLLSNKRIILVTPEGNNLLPVLMVVIEINDTCIECIYLQDYIKVLNDTVVNESDIIKKKIVINYEWIVGITSSRLSQFTKIRDLKLIGKKQLLLSKKQNIIKYNEYKNQFDNLLFNNYSLGFETSELELKLSKQRVKLRYLIQDLHYSISDKTLHLMPNYKIKRQILLDLQYINQNDLLLMKGKICKEINTCHELLLTECIMNGVFRNLPSSILTALLSMFISQINSKEKITIEIISKINPIMADKIEYIEQDIIKQIVNIQSKNNLKEDLFDFKKKYFNSSLVLIVYQWCEGKSFSEICKMTSIMEGTIVRSMLRLIETLLEVKKIATIIENSQLEKQMDECVSLVKRDIVYTDSLYIQ